MSSMQAVERHYGENDSRPRPVVLLAEDHEDTRRIYGLILRHFGFDVEEASSGEEAIEIARHCHPSLVLLDIGLPGIDGWQTGRILKADPETTNIPLIAFSAGVDSTDDLIGRATFDGYIRKPVSPLDLARRVGAYLELLT
jgi:two-component system, cell cycle response regulator DivK